jgi:hypothetical protein
VQDFDAIASSVNGPRHEVLFVYMGGSDCPPCRGWRAVDLPKFQASPEFKHIEFAFDIKNVEAPVPPTMFLPESVKPYKSILDEASGGGAGSPRTAADRHHRERQGLDYLLRNSVRKRDRVDAPRHSHRRALPAPALRQDGLDRQVVRCILSRRQVTTNT